MALYGSASNPIIEVLIDGVWTDVSSRVRGEQKVVITRGRSSEQSRPAPQRCNLTFENPDGYFSNRLPTSVNYRKFGKNTQIRVRAGTGDNYLRLPYNDQISTLFHATTADKAVLDITGDIDVRADIWPHSWRPTADMVIGGKYQTASNQRSWALILLKDGKVGLIWSTAGTDATRVYYASNAVVPASSKRLAVRATLDVDNGAGSKTVTFYTATTYAGPWTILGTATTSGSTTSIFSSSAALTVGGAGTSRDVLGGDTGFGGKVYAFQVYSGIAGTLVASMDATSRSVGDTTWSDGLGTPNTWTLAGTGARLTSDRVRFWGELATLKTDWDLTGRDVTVPAVGYGLLRRLGQGAKPLNSPLLRNFGQYSPYAYWPLEDSQGATSAASGANGGTAASVTAVDFGLSEEAPPGATSVMKFQGATSRLFGKVNVAPVNTGTVSVVFYVKLTTLPATSKVFFTLTFPGFLKQIDVALSSAVWTVSLYSTFGLMDSSSTAIAGISPAADGWIGYNLLLKTSGTDLTYSQRWDAVGMGFAGGTGPTTVATPSAPPVRQVTTVKAYASNDAAFNDMMLSHIFVSTLDLDLTTDAFRGAANAYDGETAAARLQRLSDEEGVDIEITGAYDDTEAMGYQTTKTYPDLIAECWDIDGGIGGEVRDALMLSYRTRASMENREDLILNYDLSDLSDVPKSADDDLGLINDVTVSRTDGSSARSVIEEGYNSILDPPSGVGRYDTSVTVNASTDEQLPSIAGWMALVGAWDQDRYPNIAMSLHRSRPLADAVLFGNTVALNLGDTVLLADLPAWMPPDDVPEIVQGYAETLSKFMWDIVYNGTPAGPYRSLPVLGSDVYVPRLDMVAHTVSNALTTTGTSLTLVTPAGSARWVDSATYPSDFPMDVVIGGEVMSLTAITGTASPQTGTVTRSVNGVVKSHLANQPIRLARPFYVGR